jgi:hypothetical protein
MTPEAIIRSTRRWTALADIHLAAQRRIAQPGVGSQKSEDLVVAVIQSHGHVSMMTQESCVSHPSKGGCCATRPLKFTAPDLVLPSRWSKAHVRSRKTLCQELHRPGLATGGLFGRAGRRNQALVRGVCQGDAWLAVALVNGLAENLAVKGYPLFRLASDTGWIPASLLVGSCSPPPIWAIPAKTRSASPRSF